MNKIQNLVLGGIAVLVLVLMVVIFNLPGKTIVEKIIEKQVPVGGQNFESMPVLNVGGVKTYYGSSPFVTGRTQLSPFAATTSVICRIPFPSTAGWTTASTSIISAGVNVQGIATGTAPKINIFKGANLATTTVIGGDVMATNTPMFATSSLTVVATATGGLPNEYVIFDLQQTAGGFPYLPIEGKTGSCSAVFREF